MVRPTQQGGGPSGEVEEEEKYGNKDGEDDDELRRGGGGLVSWTTEEEGEGADIVFSKMEMKALAAHMRWRWDQQQQQRLKAADQLCPTTRPTTPPPLWEEGYMPCARHLLRGGVSVPFISPVANAFSAQPQI